MSERPDLEAIIRNKRPKYPPEYLAYMAMAHTLRCYEAELAQLREQYRVAVGLAAYRFNLGELWNRCALEGGGMVKVPGGTWYSADYVRVLQTELAQLREQLARVEEEERDDLLLVHRRCREQLDAKAERRAAADGLAEALDDLLAQMPKDSALGGRAAGVLAAYRKLEEK